MKRRLLSLPSLAFIAFVVMAAINKPSSSGAPSASTGAPDEQTCGMSGCHDDNAINAGTATVEFEIPNSAAGGALVPIKIKINDPLKIRFGFQVTVLDESNNKVGDFVVTDSSRTQVIAGKVNLPDRDYLTYTYYGTMGSGNGNMEWNAMWKAPDTKGKVTFYLATLSANNDGNDKGDMVYTTSKSLMVAGILKMSKPVNANTISMSIKGKQLSIKNPHQMPVQSISVCDVSGKAIPFVILENQGPDRCFELPENFTGIAIVSVNTGAERIVKKCFVSAFD